MVDNDASNMSLDYTAKRKKRGDTKQPIIRSSTLSRFMAIESHTMNMCRIANATQ